MTLQAETVINRAELNSMNYKDNLKRLYLKWVGTLVILEILIFFLFSTFFLAVIPLVFSLNSNFASYQTIFAISLCLSIFVGLYLFYKRIRKRLAGGFSQFIYQLEIQNKLESNVFSALLYNTSTESEHASWYQTKLTEQAEQLAPKCSVKPLLPLKALTFTGLACLIVFTGIKTIDTSKIQLSLRYLFMSSHRELQFTLNHSDNAFLKNENIDLSGSIVGEPLFPVNLIVHDQGGQVLNIKEITQLQLIQTGNYQFSEQLPGYSNSVIIHLESGLSKSPSQVLTIADFPQLIEESISIQQPEYIEKSNQIYNQLPPQILEGSAVNHKLTFNKPIKSQTLVSFEKSIQIKKLTDKDFMVSYQATDDTSYTIEITDQHGFSSKAGPYEFTLQKDLNPTISILSPKSPFEVKKGMIESLPIEFRTQDDHKITKVQLELRTRQQFEMTWISSTDLIDVLVTPSKVVYQKTTCELQSIYLNEGDRMHWNLLVWDSKPNAKPSRSTTQVVMVPWFFQQHEAMEQESTELTDSMSELQEDQQRAETLAKRIKEQTSLKSKNVALRQAQTLKELQKAREELQKKAEDIEKKLNQHLSNERKNNLLDEGTLRNLEKAKSLYEKLVSEMQIDLGKWQSMNKDMGKVSQKNLSKMMQEFDKKKFSEEISRQLKALEKIHAKRKLSKNLAKMEHLLKQHNELGKKLQENKKVPKNISRELNHQFEEIKKQLEELSKNENLDPNLRKAIKDNLKNNKNLSQEYQKLQKELSQKNSGKAQKTNQQIENQLNQMSQMMKEEMMDSSEQVMQVDMQQLYAFLAELNHVAGYILDTEKGMSHLTGLKRKRYAAQQFAILTAGLKSLQHNMKEAYQNNLDFQKSVLQIFDVINTKSKKLVSVYESDYAPRDTKPIHEIYRINNQLVLMLLRILEQMNNQSSQMEMENYLNSLEQLTKQQQQLNQKTKQMQQGFKGSQQQRQQMMEQMAFQQQLIRESTERLYEKYQKRIEMAKSLQGITEEMKKVEKKLKHGETGEETQEAQQKIEYRLLEATNAMKEQKESKKRKGKTAKSQNLQAGEDGTGVAKDSAVIQIDRENIPEDYKGIVEHWLKTLQSK
jgi:hypothetical protein